MTAYQTDIAIIGAGITGLTIALTAARYGYSVRCYDDGRPGASLTNFGQLHSGAVYAPELPNVARSCWIHREAWVALARRFRVGALVSYGLFTRPEAAEPYLRVWNELGIHVEEISPQRPEIAGACPTPATAFRLPDYIIDPAGLLADLQSQARVTSAITIEHRTVAAFSEVLPSARILVLAAGTATPQLLDAAGITHTLNTRGITWGETSDVSASSLVYWLDGDLLAAAPALSGLRLALPSKNGQYGTNEQECTRLRDACAYHGMPNITVTLHTATVCEPGTGTANPISFVADLTDPPPGWSSAGRVIVALPGKWTTAWHCADLVLDAVR